MGENPLLNTGSLPEFFRAEISRSIQSLRVEASPHAEFYLVNLLVTFAQAENLFERSENGEVSERPLALRFFDALMAEPNAKFLLLKKLGDIALYTTGFFADSVLAKVVSFDYYIQMGGNAYSSLAQLMQHDFGKGWKELFSELAVNFVPFVDVLSHVAESSGIKTDVNLLKLYERWLKTGSERTREILMREGIIPNDLAKTKYTQ